MTLVLVSMDLQAGVFRRYRKGANDKPIFEDSVRIDQWDQKWPVDPESAERFRRDSTAFDDPSPPEAA